MGNVSNPNMKGSSRFRTDAAKVRKRNQKKSSLPRDKEARADATRGARPGLLPTSGPRAPMSSKKKRKLEKRMAHALRRKMEAEGEVEMKDVPEEKTTKSGKRADGAAEEVMEVEDDIA